MRMLYQFVSARNVGQRDSLPNLKARPTRGQRRVQIASGLCLGVLRKVTAQRKYPDVLEYHRPERNGRRFAVGGVGRNRTAGSQQLDVGLNVCAECNLDDVIDALGSERPDVRAFFRVVKNS
jgi:hypothetical protein